MPQSHSVISGRHHDAQNILQADRGPVGTVRQVRVIERTGAIIFQAMTVRVMRLHGGDSEAGDCWGSRKIKMNTIIRSTCQIEPQL